MDNLLSQMVAAHKRLQPEQEPFTVQSFRGDGQEEGEPWLAGFPIGSIKLSNLDLDRLLTLAGRGLIESWPGTGRRKHKLTQNDLNYFK